MARPTRALYTGNPAIEAARPDFCNISDQRGVQRPQSGPCDVGAYEGSIDLEATVTTTVDENDGECAIDCTLREAVSLPNVEVIDLPAGRYELTMGALPLDGFEQIYGAGGRTTTIDANGLSRVAYVTGSSNALYGVTITGGNAGVGDQPDIDEGGGIRVGPDADLVVIDSAIVGNVATANGGGISNDGALGFIQSTVSGNVAGNGITPGSAAGSTAVAGASRSCSTRPSAATRRPTGPTASTVRAAVCTSGTRSNCGTSRSRTTSRRSAAG